ncbi:MAG: hypothetical protein WC799_00625 [Desulfobacteraceae bacterium]
MYIARTNIKGRSCFSIRKSFLENGVFLSRELMDLGGDPRIFVRYPHGRSFYVDEAIEDTLKSMGETVDYDNLERMFWPFVRPDVKRRYEGACSRASENSETIDVSAVHLFDKRRLSYLRTGGMNQRHIGTAPDKLFKTLTEKSRDEIEQRFMVDENKLPAREIKAYVFVIFDLQRHFNTLFAREMPQALDQDKVADHLLDDICILNRDKVFWSGMDMESSLHAYLIRYLIMFFDTEYQKPRFLEDMEFARMHRRRYYRQTERPKDQVYAEATTVFGVSYQELKSMSKRQLQRLYRKKARDLHPDHGGSHEQFIEFSRLYEEIMSLMG